MTNKVNVELLREAYAIFDGIPAERVNLSVIASGSTNPASCRTVACGMGWLGMHPTFNSLGLTFYDRTVRSRFKLAVHGRPMSYATASAHIFGFPKYVGVALFSPWGTFLDRAPNNRHQVGDKARLLSRIKTYLNSLA